MSWEESLEINALKCDAPRCRKKWVAITDDTLACLCRKHYEAWKAKHPMYQTRLKIE